MKKIFLVLFLFPFLFSSCIDNVEDYQYDSVLVGTWKIAEIGTANSNNVIVYTSNSNGICEDDTLTFNQDDTYELDDYALVNGACESEFTDGTFEIEIKTITLTYQVIINNVPEEVTQVFTIVALFKNEAIITFKDNLGVNRYLKIQRILEE